MYVIEKLDNKLCIHFEYTIFYTTSTYHFVIICIVIPILIGLIVVISFPTRIKIY